MLTRLRGHLERERYARPPQPQEPTEQDEVRQRQRRRPDAQPDIGPRRRPHLRRGGDEEEEEIGERRLECDDGDADHERETQRPPQHGALLEPVARAERLRGEPDRAHLEEAEAPEDEVEEDRPDRDRAQEIRLPQPPDDARIDEAQQGR